MADAVVLYDGTIIKLSAISNNSTFDPNDEDIMFFNQGSKKGTIKRFKLGPNSYIAIFKPNTTIFLGYYLEKNFWNSNVIKNKNSKTNTAEIKNLGEKFVPQPFSMATENDRICMAYEKIYLHPQENSLNRVTYYKTIEKKDSNFTGGFNIENILSTLHQVNTEIKDELESYYTNIVSRKYLSNNGELYELGSVQKDVLFDIISVLDMIYKDTKLFEKLYDNNFELVLNYHISLATRFDITSNTIDQIYHKIYNEEFFARLRLGLIDFMYFVKSYGPNYNLLTADDLSVCIINIFPVEELAHLRYLDKKNLLNKIIKQNKWISGDWWFNLINTEKAIIKLVKSIACKNNDGDLNYAEIDSFFDFLNDKNYDSKETNFEILYSKINDGIIGDDEGKGNKGLFVDALYKDLWVQSKYNPNHEVSTIANVALDIYKYNSTPAYGNIVNSGLDVKSAPLVLSYESEKVFVWYVDNFKFLFSNRKIEAYQETYVDYGKYSITASSFANTGSYANSQYILYGTYDFFQPVVLSANNLEDTIIKMPVKGIPPNADPKEYINNSIPVFYLKYIDDSGDYSDAKETIGLIIDVALTCSGIGNISKLRHFRHLSKFGRLATLIPEETILYYEAVSGVSTLFQITAGMTRIMLTYMEKQRLSDPGFYQKLDYLMFAIELASLSFDALAQRTLRKRAKEVLDYKLSNGGWPSILDDEAREVKKIIEKLAIYDDVIIAGVEKLAQNIKNKVQLFNKEKQFAFLSDFADKSKILDELDLVGNSYYIDNWASLFEINCLDRRQLEFIGKQFRTNAIIRYYAEPSLREILEPLHSELRIIFLEQYGTIAQLSGTTFNKLKLIPSKLEILLNYLNKLKKGNVDDFDIDEIFAIINSNLSKLHVNLLSIKSNSILANLAKKYLKEIQNTNISINRLRDLQNGNAFSFFSELSKKDAFKLSNKLLVKVQPYNGNNAVGSQIIEHYLSGLEKNVKSILGNSLKGSFKEPIDYAKFEIFKKRAIDITKRNRYNDTELKFIFNFLEQHWNKGNRFVIEMESTLYTCSSCQGYLVYLKELAKQEGKILEINVFAHPRATRIEELEKFLKE